MSAERSAAFDRIDRFLRGNLDDTEYAPYAEALDVLWSPTPARGSAVWMVRDALDEAQAAFPTEKAAVNYTHGWVGDGLLTVTRETLLTPAQRDVLVSAAETRDFYRANVGENGHPFPLTDLFLRVDTLRAQEGE